MTQPDRLRHLATVMGWTIFDSKDEWVEKRPWDTNSPHYTAEYLRWYEDDQAFIHYPSMKKWNPFTNLVDAMGLLEKFYEWDMQRISTDWGYMYSVHVRNNDTKYIYPAMGRILNEAIIQAVERATGREGGPTWEEP